MHVGNIWAEVRVVKFQDSPECMKFSALCKNHLDYKNLAQKECF